MRLYEKHLTKTLCGLLCVYILLMNVAVIGYAISDAHGQPTTSPTEPVETTVTTEPEATTPDENPPLDEPETPTVPIETPPTEPIQETIETTTPIETTVPETTPPTEPETLYFDVPLSEDLQDHIFTLCKDSGVNPELVVAMIRAESTYNPNCIGDGGDSLGLMQIQPKWHQWRMDKLNCPDLMDPYQNVTVAIDILTGYYNTGKSEEWILMAYNGGAKYADRKAEAGEISDYAVRVLGYKDELSRG